MQRMFPSSRWLVLIAVGLFALGCKKKLPDPDSAGPAPPVVQGTPATEDECKEFGEKLAKAVAEGDKAEVDRLIRINDLIGRCISDLGMSASEKQAFLTGAAKSSGQFADLIIQTAKEGGSYTLLRVRTVDGRARVLLRLIVPEGAVNYHEYTVSRYPDGQVATEDIYVYAAGEPLTQTLRRFILGMLAERNQGALARVGGEEQVFTKHMGDIKTMAEQVRAGQH